MNQLFLWLSLPHRIKTLQDLNSNPRIFNFDVNRIFQYNMIHQQKFFGPRDALFLCSFVLLSLSSFTSSFQSFAAADPSSLSFWQTKWDSGQTNWHKSTVHPSLKKYADEVLLEGYQDGGARILVPLCGKSMDIAHLAKKRKVAAVVGVEGVEAAIQQFSKEHDDLEVTKLEQCPDPQLGDFVVWEGASVQFLNGNFFSLTQEDLYDGIWDRAAMVAIPPESREKYVEKLGALLHKPKGRILLATLTRPDGNVTKGPPFSIDEKEVRRLYDNRPWVKKVTLLEEHSALATEPWYKAIKMYFKFGGDVKENIFLIETR